MVVRVCVVGAGVVGLSTALRLLEEWPPGSCHVTVMADHFNTETTSDGAFGIWTPHLIGDTPAHKVEQWSGETLEHMLHLAKSPEARKAGTFILKGYFIYKKPYEMPEWKKLFPHYHQMSPKELAPYSDYKYGWCVTTAATECRDYLPWLVGRIISKGARILKRRIKSISELYDSYDVIVNCCGLRAWQLVGDQKVFPIKGQTIRLEAPWLKHFVIADDESLYVIPGAHNVLMGGSNDTGVWDTNISAETRKRIFEGCCEMEPSMKDAKIIREWSGLRPGRSCVRLEKEDIRHGQRNIRLVHNYGHGGSGITVHWGCAREAVQLALDGLAGGVNSKL